MWKIILALSLSCLLSPAQAKSAKKPAIQPPLSTEFKYEPSLKRVDDQLAQLVGADKQNTLRQMAVAAVLSDFCAAVDLDQAKFKKEFDAVTAGDTKRKPAEQRDLENKVMTYFGVYVGLLVAEATDRLPTVCEIAQTIQKDQKPVSRFWLPASAAPAQPAPAAKAARQ